MTINKTKDSWLLIFDLDGLIIDSLAGLSDALVQSVLNSIKDFHHVDEFLAYDFANAGKSRFKKIDYALMLAQIPAKEQTLLRNQILHDFDKKSFVARCNSRLDANLFKFKDLNRANFKLALLSNCDNEQLLKVVNHHNLEPVFGKEIFGTPPEKKYRIQKIINDLGYCPQQVQSISDSSSDMIIAETIKARFVWIRRYARLNEDVISSCVNKFESLLQYYHFLNSGGIPDLQ